MCVLHVYMYACVYKRVGGCMYAAATPPTRPDIPGATVKSNCFKDALLNTMSSLSVTVRSLHLLQFERASPFVQEDSPAGGSDNVEDAQNVVRVLL